MSASKFEEYKEHVGLTETRSLVEMMRRVGISEVLM
jgi:hypothetical protein